MCLQAWDGMCASLIHADDLALADGFHYRVEPSQKIELDDMET